ncbi:methyltransferase [Pseudonocardia spinosispora]|uniref:methyltransferase n=1 Tax=Pseudonocardia spinosispora TaxID=103441 RepID=UPI0004256C73|nr:class I SAM-dependent methyltransferase [Pseudonocardia spinosispora]
MTSLLSLHGDSLRWISATGGTTPRRLVAADDRLTADRAARLAGQRTGMVWRGDYRGARQLLTALGRRIPVTPGRHGTDLAEAFREQRRNQARRAGRLGMLLVPIEPGFVIPLRNAPDVTRACAEVYPELDGPSVIALRELLGVIGAHEWRTAGVPVVALGTGPDGAPVRIRPRHGVFAPTRNEYIDLVAAAPLPCRSRAIDVGTGTGVLAALLATRGVARIVATDITASAVACATDNMRDLGLSARVEVQLTDLFPTGRAPLVVCNPPWLPAAARTDLDRAVYDPGSRMLTGFLHGLAAHLEPAGEGWLVLSDLAERLGLRRADELTLAIHAAGLRVIARTDTTPAHSRAADPRDPLHAARSAEQISLYRLTAA